MAEYKMCKFCTPFTCPYLCSFSKGEHTNIYNTKHYYLLGPFMPDGSGSGGEKNDKHQRKFSLSLPLSFGVNRPLICRAILIPFTSNIVRDYTIHANSYYDSDGTF